MQALTTDLVRGLRHQKHTVDCCVPRKLLNHLPKLIRNPPTRTVFAHGPGPGVLLWSGVLRRLIDTQIIWLAPRPAIGGPLRFLTCFSHVDVVLSERLVPELAAVLKRCNGRYHRLVHGVNRTKFRRPQAAKSGENAYPEHLPLLLHVGHVRRNRGLETLASVKRHIRDRGEVVLISSPTFRADRSLLKELEAAGVIIKTGYIEDIEAHYTAAALYLFPTSNEQRGAVDLPLSVLEALACGTPVLTTRFGSLPKTLANVQGVRFADQEEFPRICAEFISNPKTSASETIELPLEYDSNELATRFVKLLETDGTP